MKRLIILMIGTAVLVGFSWTEAQACTCALPFGSLTLKQQVKKARKESQAVFAGKVMEVKSEGYGVTVKFHVETVWKGKLSQEVTISTGQGGGDCGYRFQVGDEYVVYAYGSDGRLSTNICQRTAPLSEDEVTALGRGRHPLKR